MVESLGGSYHPLVGDDIPDAILDFARANNATQIVIGASRRNPIVAGLTGPGTGMTITRASGSIDVHVVSHDYIGKGRVLPRLSRGLNRKRRLAGLSRRPGSCSPCSPRYAPRRVTRSASAATCCCSCSS